MSASLAAENEQSRESLEETKSWLLKSPCPHLPVLPMGAEVQPHREKDISSWDFADLSCLIAKQIPMREALRIPAAKAALDKEWRNLWDIKTWDPDTVREYDDVCAEAKKKNKTVHFGRVFAISTLRGSELPEGDPGRVWKGRVCFQGNNVKDQDANVAVFQDMVSSTALMEAGKFVDVISLLPGFGGTQADAKQAYTQCLLLGDETWVFLPREQWPDSWKKFKNPVVRLRLALYGHPLSGAFWGNHCTAQLISVGWIAIPEWDGCFVHPEHRCVLSVYVDDFKMAGRPALMEKAWKDIRKVINTDDPVEFGKYLGCSHRRTFSSIKSLPTELIQGLGGTQAAEKTKDFVEQIYKGTRETLSTTKDEDEVLPAMEYEMSSYLEQCVDLYLELADSDENTLKFTPTPSLDDNALKDEDLETTGKLGPHAAKILMKVLYAARMCRYDLLFAVCSLARNITKWSRACDKKMHRLISYCHHHKDLAL